MAGKLYAVGVGPGDPELITIKAVKTIKNADCIACPKSHGEPGTAYKIARPIASLFVGYDAELLEMTVGAFRIFLFAFILAGGNLFASSFFTALNDGPISAVISFMRTLVFELLSVVLLPIIFGVNGIWGAVAVAQVASCILSWAFLFTQNKKYHYLISK